MWGLTSVVECEHFKFGLGPLLRLASQLQGSWRPLAGLYSGQPPEHGSSYPAGPCIGPWLGIPQC